jgi:hypothetical protein
MLSSSFYIPESKKFLYPYFFFLDCKTQGILSFPAALGQRRPENKSVFDEVSSHAFLAGGQDMSQLAFSKLLAAGDTRAAARVLGPRSTPP